MAQTSQTVVEDHFRNKDGKRTHFSIGGMDAWIAYMIRQEYKYTELRIKKEAENEKGSRSAREAGGIYS
jgi:hypothetical protein